MNSKQQPMRSVWHSLLWKEWQEHKWKLVVLTVLLMATQFSLWFASDRFFSMGDTSGLAFMCYGILASMFLGMNTAGGESGRGTLPFLSSTPSPLWQPGVIKLGMAILTAITPLLVLMLASLIFQGWPEEPIWKYFFLPMVWIMLAVASLVLWVSTTGYNRTDEVRAGAIAFLAISGMWVVFSFIGYFAWKWHLDFVVDALYILAPALPGGIITGLQEQIVNSHDRLFLAILVGAIGHGCVLAWYLRRFGSGLSSPRRTEGNTPAVVLGEIQKLGPPMRNQFAAIAWKQFREIGPLALISATLILLLSTVIYLFNMDRMRLGDLGEMLAGVTLTVCFFVTVVAGFGVFFEDLQPRVDDFWRSQPMNFPLWFGVKFFTGASMLVVTFGSLWLIGNWLTGWELFHFEAGLPMGVIFGGTTFLLIYTLSMATYCTFRQPIYAAVVTLGLLVSGFVFIRMVEFWLPEGIVKQWFGPIIFVSMLFFQACAIALAWCAVRRNWGLKG